MIKERELVHNHTSQKQSKHCRRGAPVMTVMDAFETVGVHVFLVTDITELTI